MNISEDKKLTHVKPKSVDYDFFQVNVFTAAFNYLIASIPEFTEYGFKFKLSEKRVRSM